MEKPVSISNATLDSQTGRAVVQFRYKGGEVEALEFASLIPELEEHVRVASESVKRIFEKFLTNGWEKSAEEPFDPFTRYKFISAVRNSALSTLDLARTAEISLRMQGLGSNTEALEKAVEQILDLDDNPDSLC